MATALELDDRQVAAGSAGAPRLRLTARGTSASRSRADKTSGGRGARSGADGARPPVLIAGGDPATRAQVRDELAAVMPGRTRFEELGAFWQLLARAPESSAVILSGDLDDIPVESLLHTLAHRHPDLPVLTIGAAAGPAQ